MKTYIEYEPQDIVIGEGMDPVHGFLLGQIMLVGLVGFKPRESDPPDDPTFPLRRLIAEFLNNAQKAGFAIVKSEIPAPFNASGRSL